MSLCRLYFVLAVYVFKAAAPLSGEETSASCFLRADNVVLLVQLFRHSSFSISNNIHVTFSRRRQAWRPVLPRRSSPTPFHSASLVSPIPQIPTRHDLAIIENALRLPKLALTTP